MNMKRIAAWMIAACMLLLMALPALAEAAPEAPAAE